MSDNLACARARESGTIYADRMIGKPDGSNDTTHATLVAAFEAGAIWRGMEPDNPTEPESGQAVGLHELPLRELARAAAYWSHYWQARMTSARKQTKDRDPLSRILGEQSLAEVEAEAGMAAALSELMDSLNRNNPAEVLRRIALQMVDGETVKGVNHASFDQAAAIMDEPADDEWLTGQLVTAMRGCGVIEKGAGWVKVHGVPESSELFAVLSEAKGAADGADVVPIGREAREGSNIRPVTTGPMSDPETVEGLMGAAGMIEEVEAVQDRPAFRDEGVADLMAFRLTTADPSFDPEKPVTVNGYLYRPVPRDG